MKIDEHRKEEVDRNVSFTKCSKHRAHTSRARLPEPSENLLLEARERERERESVMLF
jgi:hypothetical protein